MTAEEVIVWQLAEAPVLSNVYPWVRVWLDFLNHILPFVRTLPEQPTIVHIMNTIISTIRSKKRMDPCQIVSKVSITCSYDGSLLHWTSWQFSLMMKQKQVAGFMTKIFLDEAQLTIIASVFLLILNILKSQGKVLIIPRLVSHTFISQSDWTDVISTNHKCKHFFVWK